MARPPTLLRFTYPVANAACLRRNRWSLRRPGKAIITKRLTPSGLLFLSHYCELFKNCDPFSSWYEEQPYFFMEQ